MKIKVQDLYGGYANVTVYTDNTTIELRLLDDAERSELAEHLREVASEIWPVDDEENTDD
jgi:hypothetical protein